jgi:hypothetical protein
MKRRLIGLVLTIFILTGMNVFGQGLWCDIDFGCFLTDDWKPTLPPSGSCHATTPDLLKLYARSCWSDGRDCPINWAFQLQAPDYNSDDCYTNGCHKHSRVLDPSQYQDMLTSSGGLRLDTGPFSNAMNKGNSSYFEFNAARPEASGIMKLSIRASIPPNCDVVSTLEHNPGWILCGDGPEHYFCTSMALPYHINGLVELLDGDDYIKNAPINNHVAHNQYGTPEMNRRLQNLASAVRTQYHDNNSEGNYYVRISFNDLSLEYGGIFDVRGDWDCHENDTWQAGHLGHRLGRSADLNVGERDSTPPQCLQCDSVQDKPNCESKYSTDFIEITDRATGQEETLRVKDWIDRMAGGHNLHEKEPAENRLIHLEMD